MSKKFKVVIAVVCMIFFGMSILSIYQVNSNRKLQWKLGSQYDGAISHLTGIFQIEEALLSNKSVSKEEFIIYIERIGGFGFSAARLNIDPNIMYTRLSYLRVKVDNMLNLSEDKSKEMEYEENRKQALQYISDIKDIINIIRKSSTKQNSTKYDLVKLYKELNNPKSQTNMQLEKYIKLQ